MKFKKISGVLLIVLGVMHLIAEITSPALGDLQIFQQMNAYIINFLGEHTLYEFLIGFSYTMGLLFIFCGILIMLSNDKKAFIFTFFFLLVLTGISLKYFHPIAYGIQIVSSFMILLAIKHREYA